ncbi:transglycosylase SLT domain-containing protein [Chloroflexus sp.]|uniref:transglycosylase SLT domain-containing protein n=1 Tax=Chloroflexus sp. TaxID=1904827 RepID=UPI00260C9CBF|nr:transglycosylase SLT domain-containing protein [uncultured Chloroflexus sp.]
MALTQWRLVGFLLCCCLVACSSPTGLPSPTTTTTLIPTLPTEPPLTPADLLQRAQAAAMIGDAETQGAALSQLLQLFPTADEAPAARLLLARLFADYGRWTSTIEVLRPLLTDPATPVYAPSLLLSARAHEGAGSHAAAIDAYQRYEALGTPLAPYAALRAAAQFQALQQFAEAETSYLRAATGDIAIGQRAAAYERAIELAVAQGRLNDGLAYAQGILGFAVQPNYRSQVLARAADLAASAGDPATASALRRDAIATYAGAAAASAADALRAAGDPALDPYAAAQAYRAMERWQDAIAMLDQAIAAGQNVAEALRQRGLARRALGDFSGALADLAAARDDDAGSDTSRQAALDWIQTYGQSGATAEAAALYRQYAADFPTDPRAPVALDRAAQLYDRLGDEASAMAVRRELGERYPTTTPGITALHRLALSRFDSGDVSGAREVWHLLAQRGEGIGQALGAFWAGKTAQRSGDPIAADYFRQALQAAPDSYYAARAAEELGEVPVSIIPPDAPITTEAWNALAEWVQTWTSTNTDQTLALVAERARLLYEVGLYSEALGEWLDGLRQAGETPQLLLDLAQRAYQAGATYPALLAAERLALLAPADVAAPTALRRLRFPTPYPELVQREAAAFGVDPLLMYALIRQESLFNPAATSWVGARGLAQIMPDTGRGIAQNLGVTTFQLDDLYRPHVSIRFGAFYLGRRIRDMNGSLHGALAAYNGGLGNAQRWAGGNVVLDPDRFVETIDFSETRHYVWAVYAFYGVYRELYAPPSE